MFSQIRQLTAYSKGGVNASFTYDAEGLRGSKTVNGVKTTYQYVGDKLYYEKRGDNQEFYYFYDGFGHLSTIYYTFGGSRAIYHVTTNMQGDVNAIYNSSGTLVARYEYDAWGNTLSVTDASGNPITAWYNIANANPIRYRGYYYDKDLDLYYLQSRYFDSNTGRFLNADKFVTTGQGVLSYNMFAYCLNNPVNFSDSTGHWRERIEKIIGFIKFVIFVAMVILQSKSQSFEICNETMETSVTTPSAYFDAGTFVGEVGVSSTETEADKERGLFHRFDNVNTILGTEETVVKSGIGVNVFGIYGYDIGISSEDHIFLDTHLVSFVHSSTTCGIDGLGYSIGIDYTDKNSVDITVRAGWIIPALLVLATPNTEERQAFVPAPAY